MNQEEIQKKYAKIIAKAWSDKAFAARLFKEPDSVNCGSCQCN